MINFICMQGYYLSTKLREFFVYWQCNGILFKERARQRAAKTMQKYFYDAWTDRVKGNLQTEEPKDTLGFLGLGGYAVGPSAPIVDLVPVIKKDNVYSVKQNNVERLYIISPQKKTPIRKSKKKAKK